MARWLNWLERPVHTREVGGSIPFAAIYGLLGPLAQLVRALGS